MLNYKMTNKTKSGKVLFIYDIHKTKLSGHIWSLKDMNVPHTISWDIIARAPSFNPTTKFCRLCLTEIYHIMWSKEGATLNQRDELQKVQSGFVEIFVDLKVEGSRD